MTQNTPYFFWDYDISEDQIKAKLKTGTPTEKQWLISRILSHAKFADVWKYLTISDIVTHFSALKMRPSKKSQWQKALSVWGYAI